MAFFVNGRFQGVAFDGLRAGEYHAALSLYTDSRGAFREGISCAAVVAAWCAE